MQKKNNNYKDTIVLGVILISIGIALLFNNYIKKEREEAFNNMNLLILESLVVEEINQDVEVQNEGDSTEQEVPKIEAQTNYEPYIATLKIPKINFERGFYDKNSTLNNVNYNVLFHKSSNYPGEQNGNVILAAHSGSSSNSYFNYLYKLELGDLAYITYNGNAYTYKIVNIYKENKDGNVAIYRDKNKNVLTLITCTNDDNTKQTIYIFEQI